MVPNGKDRVFNASHMASPGKGNKNKNTSWVKLGLSVISSEAKIGIIRRISAALSKGAKTGAQFVVGCNSINKLLESNTLYTAVSTLDTSTMASDSGNKRSTCSVAVTESRADVPAAVSAVCVCRDCPIVLQNRIVEAACLQSIPVVLVPAFTEQLAAIFGIKRANCFAVRGSSFDKKRSIRDTVSTQPRKKRRVAESQKAADQSAEAQIPSLRSAADNTACIDPSEKPSSRLQTSVKNAINEEFEGSEADALQNTENGKLENSGDESLIAAMDDLREHLVLLASQGKEE